MIDLPNPSLIGVVHLPALPGSPCHQWPMDEIIERALGDARSLKDAGFSAVIVENFGDAPFFRESLEPATISAMALVGDQLRREIGLPVGVNALRNDAKSALGIAATIGASFVRVNVHTGVMATDQGILEGRAAETLRYRKVLGRRIAILADVHVKHAKPLIEQDIGLAAREVAYRGLADALIVTGDATGSPVDMDELRRVREAVPDRRVFVGSGATAETVSDLLSAATGVIVGSSLKQQGDPANPIDADLARDFMAAARGS